MKAISTTVYCFYLIWLKRSKEFWSKDTYPLSCHGKGSVKPLFKCAAALKDGGQEEVKQGPKLWQLVLEWCSGEQEAAWGHIVGVQNLG